MKREIRGFIIGVIATLAISVSAEGLWQKIDVLASGINIVVNERKIVMPNFLYNNTTYVPIRAISKALGMDIEYDKATNTAHIKEKKIEQMVDSGERIYKITVDGFTVTRSTKGYFVDILEIMQKYPGNYMFYLKSDGNYKISWGKKVFFEDYPNNVGMPEFDWYNTVLQPWLAREGWKE